MIRVVLLLAVFTLGYILWQKLKKCPPKQRRQLLIKSVVLFFIAIILLLVMTGRVHWIMAIIAALIPLSKILLSLLFRARPFLQFWRRHRQTQNNDIPSSNPANNKLAEDEAWQILGLAPGASRDEVIQAHKKLIQKLHPDRGGNNYLAAKLNAARDLLLKNQE